MISSLSLVLAQEAPPPAAGPFGLGGPMPMIIIMFVMMYFLIIRPQRKRQQEAEALQKAMKPGDGVVTIGGAHGVVASIKDTTVVIRFGNEKVEFDKSAIARVKGRDSSGAPPTIEA